MAAERHSAPAHANVGPSRLRRLATTPRTAVQWVRAKPRLRAPMVLAPLVLAGASLGWWLWAQPPMEADRPTLEQLLHAVEEANYVEAQAIAAALMEAPGAPPLQGLGLFVKGCRFADEARQCGEESERRALHRLAAGYLEQALAQGVPEELRGRVAVQAASHLLGAGQYARAIRRLHDAQDEHAPPRTEIDRLLATAYARLPNPQPQRVLAHGDRVLAEASLAPDARRAIELERIEALWALEREEEARAALDALVAEAPSPPPAALVMQARMLMRQAQRAGTPAATEPDEASAGAADASALLNRALQLLDEVQRRAPIDRPERRGADYLRGVCLRDLGDLPAAQQTLAAAQRLHFGHPAGLAAGLAEAEVWQQLDRPEEALGAFRRVLAQTPPPNEYSNPWISLDGYRARLVAAYARWLGQQQYEEAIALTQLLPPVVPADRAMLLHAEARVEWAKRLTAQAAAQRGAKGEETASHARKQYRLAGVAYARLAAMRQASREYPDDVWRSAECYFRGRDFRHAARLFQLYLHQEVKPRRADAQTYLGESLLALGELDRALASFETALALHPQHAISYRARILAAQTHLEKGDREAAKKRLRENLESERLAPSSLEWRDSLFLLGETLYREGAQAEAESRRLGVDAADAQAGLAELQRAAEACRQAAAVLEEALARYPAAPQALRAWYFLAEAHREAAKYPRKRLAALTLEATRTAVERELHTELTAAVAAYGELIERLAGREQHEELAGNVPATLGPTEQAMLRNAHFGRADALFDLGRYDDAIRAYTLAANRYQSEPAALEAFVQIASCHRRLQRMAEAHGVLEQAKVVLQRIPADADFERTTRSGRRQWEALLQLLTASWQ